MKLFHKFIYKHKTKEKRFVVYLIIYFQHAFLCIYVETVVNMANRRSVEHKTTCKVRCLIWVKFWLIRVCRLYFYMGFNNTSRMQMKNGSPEVGFRVWAIKEVLWAEKIFVAIAAGPRSSYGPRAAFHKTLPREEKKPQTSDKITAGNVNSRKVNNYLFCFGYYCDARNSCSIVLFYFFKKLLKLLIIYYFLCKNGLRDPIVNCNDKWIVLVWVHSVLIDFYFTVSVVN